MIAGTVRSAIAAVVALGGLWAAASPTPAAAADAPWWGLTSSSRPTTLSLARSEVQEIVVATPEEGAFALAIQEPGGEPQFAGVLPNGATAAQVQEALETVYGPGNVEVTGGPGGVHPFIVTSRNEDAGRLVPPVRAVSLSNVAVSARVLTEGGSGHLVVAATNRGDAAVHGSEEHPVTIAAKLPPGVTASGTSGVAGFEGRLGPVKCAQPAGPCTFVGTIPPYQRLEVQIAVEVTTAARSGASTEVVVSGGDAPSRTFAGGLTIGGGQTLFGIESYEFTPEEEGGASDHQAGSHPFQLTTTLALNQTGDPAKPPALPRDLRFNLPPGVVGDPTALPQCSDLQFATEPEVIGVNECPAGTALGVAVATIDEPNNKGLVTLPVPVFNLAPRAGEPARFGFDALGVPVVLDTTVRTGGDYGVTVSVHNLSQTAALLASSVTFWGVPSDPRHDQSRGYGCVGGGLFVSVFQAREQGCTSERQNPFLRLPTSCAAALSTSSEADSWGHAGDFTPPREAQEKLSLDNCGGVPFNPSLQAIPDVHDANSPTGLRVTVHVPQEAGEAPEGLSESDLKSTTVTLPEGVQINPSGANGLEGCSTAQVGFEGLDQLMQSELFSATPNACPDASKVGVVEEIKTPLLPNPLRGFVYLAAQNANPFGSLLALYLIAEDPISGVRIKLAGRVALNSQTGQLTTTFENAPQLPFEELKLHFFDGPRAPLTTPALCGTYSTSASFTPWSGNAPVDSSSSFAVGSGPNGRPCADPLPFSSSLTAGSTNIQAAAFTPFTTTISREDGNQNLAAVQLHMPEGLLGKLASVTPCPEPQAAQAICGSESLIGHTVASVGLGSDPYTISGGQVFITGPYKGAPYGLSIAQPAKAGPFDLGSGVCDCVVVRAKIEIDPHTSALTITSDPLPTILQGIPVQLKHVNVTVDRPGFTFNPTNCSQLAITATITGEQGATAPASVPFQVANCATLPFKPKFTALAQAKTSKANGVYLHVKVVSGPGQANIAKVKVDLPVQLPSRLTTLQKACVAAEFDANPANCPAASVVGTGTAVTPVLKSPLTGPAYLVSHGGAAFPDLEIVLQGEGITLVLDGNTDIKKGITSSTFKAVPDAPISTFDLVLPVGPHSVLAAYLPVKAKGSMCGQSLAMPTAITGQNGAVVKQTTPVSVTGCPKAKTRAQKLKAALKACKKKKANRASCVKQANKKYGPIKKKKK
jgi:hypothetical protein